MKADRHYPMLVQLFMDLLELIHWCAHSWTTTYWLIDMSTIAIHYIQDCWLWCCCMSGKILLMECGQSKRWKCMRIIILARLNCIFARNEAMSMFLGWISSYAFLLWPDNKHTENGQNGGDLQPNWKNIQFRKHHKQIKFLFGFVWRCWMHQYCEKEAWHVWKRWNN